MKEPTLWLAAVVLTAALCYSLAAWYGRRQFLKD